MFNIVKKDKYTKARLGVLSTPHGKIQTPSYVIVATHAEVKCLKPSDIKKTKTQVVICNTYHLWDRALKIQNSKLKIQGILRAKIPIMTDSGGFQVFSLGFGKENKVGKILNPVDKRLAKSFIHRQNIRITAKGVRFKCPDFAQAKLGRKIEDPRFFLREARVKNREDWKFLGPELSMKIQEKLGADIIFAFDECTSPLDGFDYNKQALERTHAWAKVCLREHKKNQLRCSRNEVGAPTGTPTKSVGEASGMLFGIVQGGRFKSLRVKSAKFISSLPFDGIGIGGSFGKDEMVETLKWIVPYLPEEKPRHLLGIGKVEDIFNAVEQGIDLFDCVIPTREARHGRIYTKTEYFDISKFRNIDIPLERDCGCSVCLRRMTRLKLYKLFKSTKPIRQAQGRRYATLHNVWFFNNLLGEIRRSIKNNRFKQFKNRFLNQFKS
ncbi:MAG: tRNA-guanine transglycosylase [Candidatus Yanofskybacteria bacterium]|nr:tRNA-guanine transglycosylase [Candidatus Yanofskybacteria bacterium]